MAYRVLIFLLLMSTWVAFSGQFDAMHLTLGVLSSAFVTIISSDLLFANRRSSMGTRIAEGIKLTLYLLWLLWEVVVANVHLLRLSLLPGAMREVEPCIVKFRTALKSDFARFLLANSITLTPGTVTVKIIGDEFYIHAISRKSSEGLDGRMEQFIAWIFEDEVEARKVFEDSQPSGHDGEKSQSEGSQS
jgi:multicomponent Na+:H+ antiporter subunit E